MNTSPIPFTHACLTDAEVRTALAQLPSPDAENERETKLHTMAMGCFLGLFIFVAIGWTFKSDLAGPLLLFLGACCLFGLIWVGFQLGDIRAIRERRVEARHVYDPLANHDLASLNQLADQFPAVKEACMRWLDEGKTLRERDLAACRVYALKEGPRVEREKALEQLSLPTGLRNTSTATR